MCQQDIRLANNKTRRLRPCRACMPIKLAYDDGPLNNWMIVTYPKERKI